MKVYVENRFEVYSGYILSGVRRYLQDRGFRVKKVEVTSKLQERVESGYVKWCIEVWVPADTLSRDGRKGFWALINWVGEKPEARESLVKMGWKSWRRKRREIVFKTARGYPSYRGRKL